MLNPKLTLKLFGLVNVPMIAFANPSLISISEEEVTVRIKLNWRTRRRDLGSMYLGALVVGADVASGILAFRLGQLSKMDYSIVFKTLDSVYLKRPESHVYFRCSDGRKIKELMDRAAKSGERESTLVAVTATCPKTSGEEPIAEFKLTLTVKKKR